MIDKISLSAAAERLTLLDKREKELREEMQRLCSRYGLLTQELTIIIEAIKVELKDQIKEKDYSQYPKFHNYLTGD